MLRFTRTDGRSIDLRFDVEGLRLLLSAIEGILSGEVALVPCRFDKSITKGKRNAPAVDAELQLRAGAETTIHFDDDSLVWILDLDDADSLQWYLQDTLEKGQVPIAELIYVQVPKRKFADQIYADLVK